jgi:hypothetical protein
VPESTQAVKRGVWRQSYRVGGGETPTRAANGLQNEGAQPMFNSAAYLGVPGVYLVNALVAAASAEDGAQAEDRG